MKQITDEIYLGSRNDIFADAIIVDNKTSVEITPKNNRFKYPFIKSYLNVAEDLNINGIELPKVGLLDGKGNDKEVLKTAVEAMTKLIKNHGNVMVVSQKGESRGALVVLSYLSSKGKLHIAKAYNLIRFKKPDIKISPVLSLMLYELNEEKYFESEDNPEETPKIPTPETPTPKAEPKANKPPTQKRGRPKKRQKL